MSTPSDYRRPLRPPQFTLRTLIWIITLLAAMFSLVNVVHPVVMAGLLLLMLLIAAHVVGNVLGTRLRDIGDRPVTKEGREIPPRRFNPQVDPSSFAPPTDLASKVALGLPILIVSSAGVLVGGISGGLWGFLSAGSGKWQNMAVGAVAFGFLGGFCSFGIFSFTQVILGAWKQASQSPQHPRQAENEIRYPL